MPTSQAWTACLRRPLLTLFAVVALLLVFVGSARASTPYQQAILADSPVGYWTFDNASDLGADSSGNGNNGTVYGDAITTTTGVDGTAGLFDGNSYIDTPDVDLGTSFTVEAWFDTNYDMPSGDTEYIMNRDEFNGSSRIFQLRLVSSGDSEFIALSGGGDQGGVQDTFSSGSLDDGNWHYIAAVVQANTAADTTTSTLYVDGSPVDRTTSPGLEPTSGSDIGLGAADGESGGDDFRGALDEMAVYNKALTAAQIEAHYEAGGGRQPVSKSVLNGTDNPSTPDVPYTSDGEPVNDATGNFTATRTDLSVGGSAPLDFERTYNSSSAATDGTLGYGWTSSYSDSLSVGSMTATVTAANGSTTTFDENADGTFSATGWAQATLVENADGTYTYTLPDGSSPKFLLVR